MGAFWGEVGERKGGKWSAPWFGGWWLQKRLQLPAFEFNTKTFCRAEERTFESMTECKYRNDGNFLKICEEYFF